MTDERIENGTQPGGGFDDDRLLAIALGLDDDPELLAAAEADAELAGRLASMRADVALIGAQVGAVGAGAGRRLHRAVRRTLERPQGVLRAAGARRRAARASAAGGASWRPSPHSRSSPWSSASSP